MSSSSRTYGRKSAKRKQESTAGNGHSADYKRQKLTAELSPSPPRSPPKPARDLSAIFDASSVLSASPPVSPTKLAKRMLGRSRTESSLEGSGPASPSSSKSKSLSFVLGRTPSLPTVLSPSKPLQQPESPPPKRPTTTARTYAGKSRSFLISYPVGAAATSLEEQLEHEADEYVGRESYTSLRARWGVDNSEDDPYPQLSPSRRSDVSSASATPNPSPSKSPSKGKGKGKGKEVFSVTSLPNGLMNPLKSITELRSKGESRRFLDEVGYLFEGMDKEGGLGLRRASALEITTKLCNPEFYRKAKAADFFTRTWDVFLEAGCGKGEDKVLDILLAFFSALVAKDLSTLSDLAQRTSDSSTPHFIPTLFSLLSNATPLNDPLLLISQGSNYDAQLRKLGFSKTEQTSFRSIHLTIKSKSSIISPNTPISTSLLISHTLASLPQILLPPSHLPSLLSSLHTHFKALPPPPSFTIDVTTPGIDFASLHNALRLLDTYLLRQWAKDDSESAISAANALERAGDEWLMDGLIALGICAESVGLESDGQDIDSAIKCTGMTFRVLVSLTHADKAWCEKMMKHEFASAFIMREIARADRTMWKGKGKESTLRNGKKASGVKKEEEEQQTEEEDDIEADAAHALDRLCLALGLLTNLVQVVDDAKDALRSLFLDPSCTLKTRSCIQSCSCAHRITALGVLMQLYLHHLPSTLGSDMPLPKVKREQRSTSPSSLTPYDPLQSADASFLLGHLSVLFGILMHGNPENQAVILQSLPSLRPGESGAIKLDRLVEQAKELGAFYSVISRYHEQGHEELGGYEGREGRLGEDVARDVILFLEELRSSL